MRQPWHICLHPPSPNKRDLTRQEVGTQILGLLRDEPNISNAEVWGVLGVSNGMAHYVLRNCGAFTPPWRRRASTCAQLHEVAIDPSVVRELTTGLFLISVGIVNGKTRSVRIYTNLDRGIVHSIHATAQMRKLSRFGFLAEAAQNKIKGRCKLLIKKFMGNVKWHLMCD